jgi:hypothetical protein
MLRPTQVVFGFLLFISIIAGGAMLFPSEPPDVPAPASVSSGDNPPTLKDQTKTLESIDKATQAISSRLDAIEKLLKTPGNGTPPPSSITSGGNGSVALSGEMRGLIALTITGLISGLASVVFWVQGKKGLATTAGLVFALSGLTLFKINFDKLASFDISFPNSDGVPTEQSITIYLPEIQTRRAALDCGMQNAEDKPGMLNANDERSENSFRIGPFPDGLATPKAAKRDNPKQADAIFELLKVKINAVADKLASDMRANHDDRLVAVLLIGSADKRALGTTKEIYASNAGLGHARAIWVAEELQKPKGSNPGPEGDNPLLKTIPIITLNSGPSLFDITAEKSASEQLAPDRSVQVCALWEKKL